MTLRSVSVLLGALLCAACSSTPQMMVMDSGVDAGPMDAGVDAGMVRMKGEDPPVGSYLTAVELNDPPLGRRLGDGLSLALDQFNQPMLAYLDADPNGDGVELDSQVAFTRWNGVDKRFQVPVVIGTVGAVAHAAPLQQVSLARDPVKGTLGVLFVHSMPAVKLALSTDEGATWNIETVSDTGSAKVSNPQLALYDGAIHAAWFDGEGRCTSGNACGAVKYRTRTLTTAFSAAVLAPNLSDTASQFDAPFAMALGPTHAPALAYFGSADPLTTLNVIYWAPPSTSATKVTDSGSVTDFTGNRKPSLSLAFKGANPSVGYHLLRQADPEGLLWYQSSTAGSAWTTPISMPRTSSVAGAEITRLFQALAISSSGKIALVGNFAANPQQQQCGGPKLSLSTDGTTFTTCSPDKGHLLNFAGEHVTAAYGSDNKLTLAFSYPTIGNPDAKAGLVLWRDP
ncbi:MAG: hypothetical protein K1X89_02630 [Myxococcaceae bacterium]|nr:hypothetical protein [Myxococcaceae bacterium]